MADEKRRINRTLTQRYDMGALRSLQNLESAFLSKLAEVYGCDEEDVPVELDLLGIYNADPAARRPSIVSLLKGAPGDVTHLVDTLMEDLTKIDNLPK